MCRAGTIDEHFLSTFGFLALKGFTIGLGHTAACCRGAVAAGAETFSNALQFKFQLSGIQKA